MPPKVAAAKAAPGASTRPTRTPKAPVPRVAAPAKAAAKKPVEPLAAPRAPVTKRKASAVESEGEEDETPKAKRSKVEPKTKNAPKKMNGKVYTNDNTTVAALKTSLRKYGLKISGTKSILITRINQYLNATPSEENAKPVAKPVAKSVPAAKAVKKVAPAKKPAAAKKTAATASKVTKRVAAPRKVAAARKVAAPKPKKVLPQINTRPTQVLDIYVFGEGTAGELGLGGYKYDTNKKPIDVARPRLNHRLSAKDVGVVQMDVGGMHCIALTHDNQIYTWGVNDIGALGRPTGLGKTLTFDEAEKLNSDNGSVDSEDEDDEYLNPDESEPRPVNPKHFPEGTQFAKVAASDSASWALTTDGFVYGWGAFRGSDGGMPFRPEPPTHSEVEMEEYKDQSGEPYEKRMTEKDCQMSPILIPELKNIIDVQCGSNHVLALDNKGKVYIWGAGEQNQLARRVVARTADGALTPREFGLQRKKIVKIGSGDYHSFAVDKDDKVYAWGHNPFAQTGIPAEENIDNTIPNATLVKSLSGYKLKHIDGGNGHTIACTQTGEVLVWGRIDNAQGGMLVEDFAEDDVFVDENGRRRYLTKPVVLPDMDGEAVSAGTDHCLVVTKDGKAYSWGFSANYQTGQGTTEEILEATQIDNTAVRGKKLVDCYTGAQFGALSGIHEDVVMNGV